MTLLGNRLLIRPVHEEKSGIITNVTDDEKSVDQTYKITYVGDAVQDERFDIGTKVMVSDAIVARGQGFRIGSEEHVLITPDNIVGLA